MKNILLLIAISMAVSIASDLRPIGVWERDLPDRRITVSIFPSELWLEYGKKKYRFSGHWDGKRFFGTSAPENSDLIGTSPDTEIITLLDDGAIKGNLFQDSEMRLYRKKDE